MFFNMDEMRKMLLRDFPGQTNYMHSIPVYASWIFVEGMPSNPVFCLF